MYPDPFHEWMSYDHRMRGAGESEVTRSSEAILLIRCLIYDCQFSLAMIMGLTTLLAISVGVCSVSGERDLIKSPIIYYSSLEVATKELISTVSKKLPHFSGYSVSQAIP